MANHQRGYTALTLEILLSQTVVVMPAINLLFASLGMNQLQVGISQAVFTITAMVINIPTGWLADRYSRRIANAIGDLVCMAGFATYVLVDTFAGVLLAESLIAIGMSASMGADAGLLKGYCDHLGKDYKHVNARLKMLTPMFLTGGAFLGGLLVNIHLEAGFWAMVVLYAVCVVLSLMTRDLLPRHTPNSHPLRDMYLSARYSLHGNKRLCARIFAMAVGRETTHVVVFITTPLFLVNGVPKTSLGVAWACKEVMVTLGALFVVLYRRHTKHPKNQVRAFTFAHNKGWITTFNMVVLAHSVALSGVAVLLVVPSPWGLAGFALLGASQGFLRAITEPVIADAAPKAMMSTVFSTAAVIAQILYIPMVIAINGIAGYSLQFALMGILIVFGSLSFVTLRRLWNNK